MYEKVVQNTSKGLFKKLFSKDRITDLAITDSGFAIIMEKSSAIDIAFENLKACKGQYLFRCYDSI